MAYVYELNEYSKEDNGEIFLHDAFPLFRSIDHLKHHLKIMFIHGKVYKYDAEEYRNYWHVDYDCTEEPPEPIEEWDTHEIMGLGI